MYSPHFGDENDGKRYYVIRSRGSTEGLLSSWFYVLESVQWALGQGYIPWVDFSDSSCQYYVRRSINNTDNASSKASGSFFADLLRKDECIEEYWFELGKYE